MSHQDTRNVQTAYEIQTVRSVQVLCMFRKNAENAV